MTEVKLNIGQSNFVNNAFDWYHQANRYAVLEAPAGYGKSFSLKYLLDKLGKRAKPLILAETNEAVNVLRNFLDNKYTTATVCSAFNLIIDTSSETPSLVQHSEPDLSMYNLLVIDEASQLSIERLDLIVAMADKHNLHVLFIGHRSQLPPVDINLPRFDKCLSPVFLQDSFRKFALTEPVRNSGSIWEFCNVLEERIYKIGASPFKFNVEKNFIENYVTGLPERKKLLSGETTILCYTNKQCLYHNERVREGIFGKELAQAELFVQKDRVIFREPAIGFKYPLVTNTNYLNSILGKG